MANKPQNEQEMVMTFAEWLKQQLVAIKNDAALAAGMNKKDRDIVECATWIFDGVKKSGMSGCHTDDKDIISMAIHYFTEETKPTKESMSLASVSHYVKNTPAKTATPAKGKASIPSKPKATIPTKKASIPTKASIPSAPQVVDDDDDFDID